MSEHAAEPGQKSRFTLPSAYTILFALIVLAAIATWVIPAGTYDLNAAGEPIPGTYHEVDAKPSRILVDSLTAPINGLYGIEDATGNINYYNSGTLFGAIDIALFILVIGGFLGVTMKTGAIQAGIGSLVQRMAGPGAAADPGADVRLRARRHDLRDGGGEPGVLRARDHGADRRRLRRAHGCRGRPARLRDRGARVDDQPVRDRDRVGDRRHPDQRRPRRAARDPARRPGDRDLLRPALRRPREGGPLEVGRLRHEGRERGALPSR